MWNFLYFCISSKKDLNNKMYILWEKVIKKLRKEKYLLARME